MEQHITGYGALHHDPERILSAQRHRAEHGPDAVGLFVGTQRYTTNTLDATAKMISSGRLGTP